MLPHQERVVAERDELHVKIDSLRVFLDGPTYSSLDVRERERLASQFVVMGEYLDILNERIDAFAGTETVAG